MEDISQILDTEVTTVDADPRDHLADRSKRFINILVDTIGYYVLTVATYVSIVFLSGNSTLSLFDNKLLEYSLSFSVYFFYFFVFESLFGKTPGKLITRTHVVDAEGNKPSVKKIAGRSLSRLVPFDAFSFFGNPPVGWHDEWSGTFVVRDRPKKSEKF